MRYEALDLSTLSVFDEPDPRKRLTRLIRDIRLPRSLPVVSSFLRALAREFPRDFREPDLPDEAFDPGFHQEERTLRIGDWDLRFWGPPGPGPIKRERITLYHKRFSHLLPGFWWELDRTGRVFAGIVGATESLSPCTHKAFLRELWAFQREAAWDAMDPARARGVLLSFRNEKPGQKPSPGTLDEALSLDSPALAEDPYLRKIYQFTFVDGTLADKDVRSGSLDQRIADMFVSLYPLLSLMAREARVRTREGERFLSKLKRVAGPLRERVGVERLVFDEVVASRTLGRDAYILGLAPPSRDQGFVDEMRKARKRLILRDPQAANAPGTDGTLFLPWRDAADQPFLIYGGQCETVWSKERIEEFLEAASQGVRVSEPTESVGHPEPGPPEDLPFPGEELENWKRLLEDGILCIYGPCGSGKVSLAEALARSVAKRISRVALAPHLTHEDLMGENGLVRRFLEEALDDPDSSHCLVIQGEEFSVLGELIVAESWRQKEFYLAKDQARIRVPLNLKILLISEKVPFLGVPGAKAGPRPDILAGFLRAESLFRPSIQKRIVEFYEGLVAEIPVGQEFFMKPSPDEITRAWRYRVLPYIEASLGRERARALDARFAAIFGQGPTPPTAL